MTDDPTDPLLADAVAFAALGDPTRLALVVSLGTGGPQPLVHLAAGTTISRQAVSRHLAVLESAGLVVGATRGRERVWELVPARLAAIGEALGTAPVRWDGTPVDDQT